MTPDNPPADRLDPCELMDRITACQRSALAAARTYPGADDALVLAITATGVAYTRAFESGAVRRTAGHDAVTGDELAWMQAATLWALMAHQVMEAETTAGATTPTDPGALGDGFALS